MTHTVLVPPAQMAAAQILVERSRITGQALAPGVRRIAEAAPATPFGLPANGKELVTVEDGQTVTVSIGACSDDHRKRPAGSSSMLHLMASPVLINTVLKVVASVTTQVTRPPRL